MILSKADLYYYMEQDKKFYPKPNIFHSLLNNPKYLIHKYIKYTRKAEYISNVVFKKNRIIGKIFLTYYHYKMHKLSWKLGFQFYENVFGPGLNIYAYGHIIVNPKAKIGSNCTIYPGVVIGGKVENGYPKIGNNVFIGASAKILGGVKIGNNVYIAPNAVVVKDVPDNHVVAGVPAKTIKIKDIQ